MDDVRLPDFSAYLPSYWFIGFKTDTNVWWWRMIPGRYKHVVCFTYIQAIQTWVFIDPGHSGTEMIVVPDAEAEAFLMAMSKLTVVRMPVLGKHLGRFRIPRLGFWCTNLVASLVGLGPCALRPDDLLAQCLRNGGMLLNGTEQGTGRCAEGAEAPGAGRQAGPDPHGAAGPAVSDQ